MFVLHTLQHGEVNLLQLYLQLLKCSFVSLVLKTYLFLFQMTLKLTMEFPKGRVAFTCVSRSILYLIAVIFLCLLHFSHLWGFSEVQNHKPL